MKREILKIRQTNSSLFNNGEMDLPVESRIQFCSMATGSASGLVAACHEAAQGRTPHARERARSGWQAEVGF